MSPAQPQGRRFFTPHFRLLPLVDELPFSAGARVTLMRCLRRARKCGEWTARPNEGAFFTTEKELAAETGLSLPTQHRRLKELAAEGVLRWEEVYEGQPLPNGLPAPRRHRIYYVDVHALETRLRIGTELARSDQSDRIDAINLIASSPPADPKNLENLAFPHRLSPSVNHRVSLTKITDPGSRGRATPGADSLGAPDRGDGWQANGSETETETETENQAAVFAHWLERVAGPRELLPGGPTADGVRRAIAKSLQRGFSVRDLLDVLDAATDARIGGAFKIRGETPFEWCKSQCVYDAGLFGGPLEKLLASARKCRETDRKRADAAARMAQERADRASCGVDRPIGETDARDPAPWQQRPTAESLRSELEAALRTGTTIRRRA